LQAAPDRAAKVSFADFDGDGHPGIPRKISVSVVFIAKQMSSE